MVTFESPATQDLLSALYKFAFGNAELKSLEEDLAEFDAFTFLDLATVEDFHSKVLAWLLNPQGSHATGEYFLKQFLLETGSATNEELDEFEWSNVVVQREWHNEVDGRIGFLDILVLNVDATYACAIENKIFSSEHSEQLTRYREALSRDLPHFRRSYVFLSPRGIVARRPEERQYWTPVGYESVLRLVEDLIDYGMAHDKAAVGAFLGQYATTLRRRVVPNTELRQKATKIYLQHKEAIDFIYENRDSYADAVERICQEAIDLQEHWLHVEQPPQRMVGFAHTAWERFESFHTGKGWAPSTDAAVLFDFDLREIGNVNVILTIAVGDNETVRRRLYESMQRHPDVFNARGHRQSGRFHQGFIRVYVSEGLLSDADFSNWDEYAVRAKIIRWVNDFANNDFLVMHQVITECLANLDDELD